MTGRRRTTKKVTPETGISGSFKDEEYRDNVGYDGPPPPVGLYPGKLTSVGQHTTTDDAIVWTFDITEGKYEGWRGWIYSNMSTTKWRTHEILVSLGIIEPQDDIEITFDEIMKKAGPVRLRIVNEDYDGDSVPKIRKVVKPGKVVEALEDSGNDDEDDEDDDFKKEEKPKPTSRRSRAKKEPEPEPEEDEEEPDEDDAEEGEGIDLDALEEELEDMDLKQLKAKAKEFGLTRAETKDLDEEDLIEAILDKAEEQNPPF